jgi:dTDP-L-rhamnose 4-epimerase
MARRILITGGAGFIGSHVAEELLERGYEVRALDSLCPQVHGPTREVPDYLSRDVELIRGDIRDRVAVDAALSDTEGVIHLAAAVGVGQSMYAVEHYTSVNNVGTAVLMEALAERRIERLVVASSMSIYGEGAYLGDGGDQVAHPIRTRAQLETAQWEVRDERGRPLSPIATTEEKSPELSSVYALSKYDQERLCLMLGQAHQIPTTALRFFNVYGPRQALSNPYTGVLAIFAARLLNDTPPLIFEDGLQRRDFVSVHDVARACRLAYEHERADQAVFNIGSGQPRTVLEVAHAMASVLDKDIEPQVCGEYRVGDIRHCFADISRARDQLGYSPQIRFDDGLEELAQWLAGQTAIDRVAQAKHELTTRGLTFGDQGRRA